MAILFLIIGIMTYASYTVNNENQTKETELVLEYKIREPLVTSENAPAIILLHGVGSNEEDLFRLAENFPELAYIISARAPLQFSPTAFGWYEVDFSTGKPVYDKAQAAQSKELITQFIDQLLAKYDIAQDKVYLVGFSQGAIMSYSVAISHPEKVAGIAALSGRMLEEDQALLNEMESLDVKVFIAHSESDNVLPYPHAEKANELLQNKGQNLFFHVHNAGHGIDASTVESLVSWLGF